MNFMVLNTGRAASRAFYLNIRNQSSLVTMSRIQLDKAVHSFVKNRDSGELKNISKSYKAFAGLKEGGRQAGLVFHGVRRLLNFPFDDRRNRKVLKLLRDALDIEVIYFPGRG